MTLNVTVDVIGVLELSSIADGFKTLDAIVKNAPVTIIKAEIINPGKYLILITGDVASVESAMDAGLDAGGKSMIDHILLTNLDTRILPAVVKCSTPAEWDAIGLLETNSVASAIEAADIAVKKADIHIVGIVTGNETGGKGMLTISGAIGNINIAMGCAVDMLSKKNQLYRDVIIPGPHGDIKGFVCGH